MYNFSDTQQDERILKALKALREMPNYMVIEGNEDKYRKDVLEHCKVTEEAIATYITINQVEGISLDEHIIELEQKAFEFRVDFLKNVEEALILCFNEDERLRCLDRFNCLYMRAPFEIDIWERHRGKSFDQFAQWHIEQGGWGSDFQGLDFDGFAQGWALDWMYTWTGKQITEINFRRLEGQEDGTTDTEVNEKKNVLTDEEAKSGLSSSQEKPILTHRQIAILHHYIGQPITRNNADAIAIKYGQTSGQKLEGIYKDLISPLNRTAQGKYTVRDIEVVSSLLTGQNKALADKELSDALRNNPKSNKK